MPEGNHPMRARITALLAACGFAMLMALRAFAAAPAVVDLSKPFEVDKDTIAR